MTTKKDKLNIYFVPWEDTGVGLYRIVQPMVEIGLQKIANVMKPPFSGSREAQINAGAILADKTVCEEWARMATWADIIYATKPFRQEQLQLLQMCQWVAEQAGKPTKLVIDLDDSLSHVNRDNPGYESYKEERQDSTKHLIEESFAVADAVVFSVDTLKQDYIWLDKLTYVNPNGIDFDRWFNPKRFKKKPKKNKKIRIGFAGASGHHNDLQIIERIAPGIKSKYPNVEFVTLGQDYNHEFIDKNLGWVKLRDYPEELHACGFDIGLAPLRDNFYNRRKSNLRVIEYSALQIPTVCSNIVTYNTPENSLKASEPHEWVEHISSLIESKEMRKSLALKAYQEVKENFHLTSQVGRLLSFLQEVHEFVPESQRESTPSRKRPKRKRKARGRKR